MSVAVISKTGIRLMPTNEYRARHLLKAGKAVIEQKMWIIENSLHFCYIEIVKEGGLSCTKQNKWLVIS